MMAQSIHSIVANKGQGATIDDVLREVRCAYLRLTAASGSEREEEATSTQREVIHLPSDGVYSRCAVASGQLHAAPSHCHSFAQARMEPNWVSKSKAMFSCPLQAAHGNKCAHGTTRHRAWQGA